MEIAMSNARQQKIEGGIVDDNYKKLQKLLKTVIREKNIDAFIQQTPHYQEGHWQVDGVQNRRVLIDSGPGTSIYSQREPSHFVTFQTGTHLFQSINVIQKERYGEHARPHDYLDDFESFFYMILWICNMYHRPNQSIKDGPGVLVYWDSPDPIIAASVKTKFLMYPTVNIAPYFHTLLGMIKDMAMFLFKHAIQKEDESISKEPRKPFLSLLEASNADYNTFIGFIEKAIDNCELEDFDLSVSSPQPKPITPPHHS
uniref:Fungal-type protein kinase domain-containing protein n=1 Tax=Psilocybe cubensis TaxID=181762 RepID=A0A8H8CEN7_PSICU